VETTEIRITEHLSQRPDVGSWRGKSAQDGIVVPVDSDN
jgi:hypothetical protein